MLDRTSGDTSPVTDIHAIQGDLTTQPVDAIVNAANEYLQHGGGVAAAIVRAGGAGIQDESDAWVRDHGPLSPGVAAVTTAGSMPARWVIHVAGPRFTSGGDNAGLLAQAVQAALATAVSMGARVVAVPAISAGIFGYPLDEAAAVIAAAVGASCGAHPGALDEVRLVGRDERTTEAFRRALDLGEGSDR